MKKNYTLHSAVYKKLVTSSFEYRVLKAIFEHERQCKSLFAFPKHPSSWGWCSRIEIARRLGFKYVSKRISRKIRKAFIWLEQNKYLKHFDCNEPGKKYGATRFILSFWLIREVKNLYDRTKRDCSRTPIKYKQEVSRTPTEIPPGWRPPDVLKKSPLYARFCQALKKQEVPANV